MKIIIALILTFLASSVAFADLRPPEPKKTPTGTEARLNLRADPNISAPTMKISKNLIKKLNAQIEGERTAENFSKTPTVVGGSLLSLAFIFGGVFLFKNKSSKIAVSLILLAICSASATIIYANVAPPPLQKINASVFSDKFLRNWRGATDTVKIEIIDDDDSIYLQVPKNNSSKSAADEEE